MRCAKSQKLYNIATVPLQICNGMDKCGKIFYCFIFFFSLLSLHFFLFSSLSLSGSLSSPSNPNPLSNLSLSLCLPLPVSLGAVALLDLGASALTKTLTFAAAFSAFGDSISWLIALTFFFARGSSCSLSTQSGGPIGPRRRLCLGWCH